MYYVMTDTEAMWLGIICFFLYAAILIYLFLTRPDPEVEYDKWIESLKQKYEVTNKE